MPAGRTRRLERLRPLACIRPEELARRRVLRLDMLDQLLDSAIQGEALRLLFEDEIGPHAATRERLHVVEIRCAVGMRVEVARPLVARLFEEPN